MGEFAETVQDHLQTELSGEKPEFNWEVEYHIDGTPVDVAGEAENELFLIELEWRRADPADNTAKLFRHLDSGQIDADRVVVFQVFTNYYDLTRGGVSSKRKNAEFVGAVASDAMPQLMYSAIDFDIDPPKRGESWPQDWRESAESVIQDISGILER